MSEFTVVVANEYKFPNIIVHKKLEHGVQYAWRINTNIGYVMYNINDNNTELDPITGEEIPVKYYYTVAHCPLNYDFDNFSWIAVPRDSVNEKYIFDNSNSYELTK